MLTEHATVVVEPHVEFKVPPVACAPTVNTPPAYKGLDAATVTVHED